MLEISHLRYDVTAEDGNDLGILRDVSLTVGDGKLVVITGPNGGGKTSLAKTIMGLYQPTAGSIRWNGTDITNLSVTDRAKAGVSYGFQQPPRFKGLKVKDLIALAAGKEDLTPAEGCQYLTQVGLCADDYINREMDSALSGGEMKRIEIATILARKSGLMIFDEPEAGIDLWSFSNLIQVFEQLHKKINGSILIISHQERILNIADRIIVLADGRVVNDGPRKDILPTLLGGAPGVCGALADKVK